MSGTGTGTECTREGRVTTTRNKHFFHQRNLHMVFWDFPSGVNRESRKRFSEINGNQNLKFNILLITIFGIFTFEKFQSLKEEEKHIWRAFTYKHMYALELSSYGRRKKNLWVTDVPVCKRRGGGGQTPVRNKFFLSFLEREKDAQWWETRTENQQQLHSYHSKISVFLSLPRCFSCCRFDWSRTFDWPRWQFLH